MSQAPSRGGFPPGMGFDPAKLDADKDKKMKLSRMELPSAAYTLDQSFVFPTDLPDRPGVNTEGKAIAVRLNQYKVMKWPQKDIYQLDVKIGDGAEKRGLIKAVWMSKAVQSKLQAVDPFFLFDWNKLAWCSNKPPEREARFLVDMDAEKGREPRPGHENKVWFAMKFTKVIRMAVISAYIERKIKFDSSVLEAITFLDHLLRQWPSEQYNQIKRSFFDKIARSVALDNIMEAQKGVYSSMRLNDPKGSFGDSTGLAINVDVANGTFWTQQSLMNTARNLCHERNRALQILVFRDLLLPTPDPGPKQWQMSVDFRELRKLTKVRFTVKHRGKAGESEYVLKRIVFDPKYGRLGANAKNVKFTPKAGPGEVSQEISIYDYFRKKYNITLQHWYLPVVETEKAGYFPMEICTIAANQQYKFKLSPDQTSSMIKFAVTRPKDRLAAIEQGINMLKWNGDPYLQHFGLEVDKTMTVSKARLLKNPEIQFAGAKLNPGTTGKWDLRGKKFLFPNPVPLKSWGICTMNKCVDDATLTNFLNVFMQTYIGHGGRIENKKPYIGNVPANVDMGNALGTFHDSVVNQSKAPPQMLMFVMADKNSSTYERIKKSAECRFGCVSQVLNKNHVIKAQPQYCSNVCMKFNAKLGGTTSRVAGKDPKTEAPFFKIPTLIIGADVSHPSPGSPQASMAALTMSMDKTACRYAAAVQTNGIRVEMITKQNLASMMMPLMAHWVDTVGGKKTGPQHIYYFRDGVSEGQFAQVLANEVADMKALILDRYTASPKFTVVVCSKRHHLRIFPKSGDSGAGDRNDNPLPGTLVERDVTHPFEYDFYLNSHSAIQGTARPVHYQVLLDEAKVDVNHLQRMIYQHCYQYMRSTTPVSLFPAVYYAHLASNRARAHEDIQMSSGPRGGQKFTEQLNTQLAAGMHLSTAGTPPTEVKPLIKLAAMIPDLNRKRAIGTSMWYI